MKPRFAGRAIVPDARWAPALTATAVALVVGLAIPSFRTLKQKEAARLADSTVGFVVDLDDIDAFVPPKDQSSFVASLREIPVSVLAARDTLPPEEEKRDRQLGFHFLWKLVDGTNAASFVARIGPRDGVMVDGAFVLETPGLAESVAGALRRQQGFLSLVEFSPNRPLFHLPLLLPGQIIRTHIIPTRETAWPKPARWEPRIVRAVRERWVRLVGVRFSPSWSPARNREFLHGVAARLSAEGFSPGEARPAPAWPPPLAGASWAAFLIALLAPVVAVTAVWHFTRRGALVPFTAATAWSAAAGVVAHGLIASPAAVVGLTAPHGIKAALVLPLGLGLLLLLSPTEIVSLFRRRVTWGDLFLIAVVLGGGLAFYLMRSGNTPRIAVTDAERGFRDVLEGLLRARPRFKEFAIGHPLLVAGLYLRGRGKGFWRDGRAFILAGMIGQISILNTFMHAPAPVTASLLRTINGWWIGALLSVPFCHLLNQTAAFGSVDGRERRP